MRHFTSTELERMQGTQESAMMDTCQLLRRGEDAADAYGVPVPVWIVLDTLECGFDGGPRRESDQPAGSVEGTQVPLAEAVLRLPLGTVLESVYRIRVLQRFDVLQSSDGQPLYEIIGEARQGPSGLLVNLREVTNE